MVISFALDGNVYCVDPQFVVAVTAAWLMLCVVAIDMASLRSHRIALLIAYCAVFAALIAFVAATLISQAS